DEAEIAYELLQENENQKNVELSHQKAHLEEITDKLRLASQELGELNKVVLFSQPYDFNELKKEIQRLKVENLEFQLERKKNQLEKLIVISKYKLSEDLKPVMQLYLQILKQDTLKEGKLEAYEDILRSKLSEEELQIVKKLQQECYQIE